MTTPRRTNVVIAALATGLIACARENTEHPEPITRLYVLSTIGMAASDGTRASGLDLDGLDSTGEGPTCVDRHADLQSVRDPAEHGVDNAMAALVPALQSLLGDACAPGTEDCFGELLAQEIASGELLLVVEVRGIDTFTNDDVEVVLHRASSCGAPSLVDGELAPGQSLALEPLATATTAAIEGGVLRASFETLFTLEITTADQVLLMPMRTARLDAAIDIARLRDGVLAGALDVDELRRRATPPVECLIPPCDGYDEIADLAPRPEDPTICSAVSCALDFAAIDAVGPVPCGP